MASKLKNLQINTLGSVDVPANQFGKAVLFKRAPQVDDEPVVKQRSKIAEAVEKAWKDVYTTVSRFKEIVSTTSFYDSESVSVSEYADDPSLLTKDADGGTDPEPDDLEKAACAGCGGKMKDGKCSSCGVAKTAADTNPGEEGVTKMSTPNTPDVATILKNHGDKLPEDVLKALQDVSALNGQVSVLSKSLEDTNSKLQAELEKSAKREYLAKAQALPNLPAGEVDKFADLLKSIGSKVTAEEFTQLEGILKSADEAIAKGALFQEIGVGSGPSENSAEAELNKRAKDKVSKGEAKTFEEGFTQALQENPELYKRYRKGE